MLKMEIKCMETAVKLRSLVFSVLCMKYWNWLSDMVMFKVDVRCVHMMDTW
jgi:hypothetical protein